MRKLSITVVILAILLVATSPVLAGWTETTTGGGVIELTPDAGDWSSTSTWTSGLKIWAIVFKPSAANDILVVRLNSLTGPRLVSMTAPNTSEMILYLPPKTIKLFVESTDCTFGTPANVRISLILY